MFNATFKNQIINMLLFYYLMSMKIIDCFIFYNELELLEYRLNVLNKVVDYFVIVESTHTFVGKEKALFFNENKHLFEKFNEKIIHIIVDDFPYKYPNINIQNNEQWKNEYFQRNAIHRGIQNLKDSDVIIISDLDEIPDPRTLHQIRLGEISITLNSLEMDLYYYNLNTKFNFKWYHAKMVSYHKYKELNKSCEEIRNLPAKNVANGGWHLSYFGDANFIQNKIKDFSHQELNNETYTNLLNIEDKIKNSRDLYNRNLSISRIEIKNNQYLPVDYKTYLSKFVS
jgi:beta-1,4-mannosyl-glycoprotein beta-1,4-N-acetylglucosaminyltransferase